MTKTRKNKKYGKYGKKRGGMLKTLRQRINKARETMSTFVTKFRTPPTTNNFPPIVKQMLDTILKLLNEEQKTTVLKFVAHNNKMSSIDRTEMIGGTTPLPMNYEFDRQPSFGKRARALLRRTAKNSYNTLLPTLQTLLNKELQLYEKKYKWYERNIDPDNGMSPSAQAKIESVENQTMQWSNCIANIVTCFREYRTSGENAINRLMALVSGNNKDNQDNSEYGINNDTHSEYPFGNTKTHVDVDDNKDNKDNREYPNGFNTKTHVDVNNNKDNKDNREYPSPYGLTHVVLDD